jgi:arginase
VAVKIVRQPNKIALLGAPTSAAAMSAGTEKAPGALRSAGLLDRLRAIGYEVADMGDDPVQKFAEDNESPRARNVRGVLKSLEALKPRVEQGVKSGALPLILSGDCSVALATIAGARRYFRHVGVIYMDRDADLNIPATSPSGIVDGMVVSHIVGRGAAELVRFWGEPPLVREPDVALFGVARLDPAEEKVLETTPLRRYPAADVKRVGPTKAAETAIERTRGAGNEIILHLDVDVIDGFAATKVPGEGGLSLEQVREALRVFAAYKHTAAIEVCGYNPEKDADGSGAKMLIDLLADVLEARLEALKASAPVEASVSAKAAEAAATPAEPERVIPAVTAGESWSSDMLETELDSAPESTEEENPQRTSEETEDAGASTSVETSEEADDTNS